MRIYWIKNNRPGAIGMMARPKGNDWLLDEVNYLKLIGVDTVVCLLENAELRELGLIQEEQYCLSAGMNFIHFPIPDRGVPESRIQFNLLISKLLKNLEADQRIVIHCRMGIGRTAVVVAAILIEMHAESEGVFDRISAVRTLDVPDTPKQKEWVLNE